MFPLIRLRSGCGSGALNLQKPHAFECLVKHDFCTISWFYSIKIIKMAANTNGLNQALANGMRLACGPAGIATCSDRKKMHAATCVYVCRAAAGSH